MLRNKTRLYSEIALFSILVILCGCKSTQLKTLEISVSNIQPTTGREVNRFVQEKEAGLTGPIYAEIHVEYEPINNYTKQEVYDELVDILKKNNWEGEACNGCSATSFSASLQQDDYPIPINIRVRIHSDENLISIRMVNPRP